MTRSSMAARSTSNRSSARRQTPADPKESRA
jgi:hypothetical protein